MVKSKRTSDTNAGRSESAAHARPTVSGPADPPYSSKSADDLELKMTATAQLAAAMPFNLLKPSEFDPEAAVTPLEGIERRAL
jgi:hypothetical protein